MKERPILFSGPMVRAILAGTKTQTRRIVKPQPQQNGGKGLHPVRPYHRPDGAWTWVLAATGVGGDTVFSCPYGQPGDRLWVRETWGTVPMQCLTSQRPVEQRPIYRAGRRVLASRDVPADYNLKMWPVTWANDEATDGWRPSTHMPRWASRLTLEVTGVRIEQLADISQADCRAEGCPGGSDRNPTPRQQFMALWDTINAKRAPWASNPWVWVVEFRRIK